MPSGYDFRDVKSINGQGAIVGSCGKDEEAPVTFGWCSLDGGVARVLKNGPGDGNVAKFVTDSGDVVGHRRRLDRFYSLQMWVNGTTNVDLGHPSSGGV